MDPTNNLTPNPTPAPAPNPAPSSKPLGTTVPGAPTEVGASVQSISQPTGSAAGTSNVNVVGAAPVAPVSEQSVAPSPLVNPIIQPSQPAQPSVANPVNPVFHPTNIDGVNGVVATDPIMQPEPAPAPDPVEEELKAPMKAAGPVPGSIGSAVSGPETVSEEPSPMASDSFGGSPNSTPQSVSFTDPAEHPEAVGVQHTAEPAKKKTSKTTLIVLSICLFLIAAVLAAVLVIFAMKGDEVSPATSVSQQSSQSSQNNTNSGGSESNNNSGANGNGTSSPAVGADTIICTSTQTDNVEITPGIESEVVQDITMTLNFVDDRFTSVSVKVVATAVESGAESTSTSDFSIDQLLAQAGVDRVELEEQGFQFDENGNIIASKDQMMGVLADGLSEYTCVSPDEM